MKNFVKNYIGKGKKVEGLEIIKINLKISDILKFAHKYNDEDYISLRKGWPTGQPFLWLSLSLHF